MITRPAPIVNTSSACSPMIAPATSALMAERFYASAAIFYRKLISSARVVLGLHLLLLLARCRFDALG